MTTEEKLEKALALLDFAAIVMGHSGVPRTADMISELVEELK